MCHKTSLSRCGIDLGILASQTGVSLASTACHTKFKPTFCLQNVSYSCKQVAEPVPFEEILVFVCIL